MCFGLGGVVTMAAITASLSLPWLLASHHLHTPLEQSTGDSTTVYTQVDLPASEGDSQGKGTFRLSQLPPRGTGSIPIPSFFFFFFFRSTWLCRDLSCSFGCIRDLLPAFSWFSVRIVPHVDVLLCVCGGRWAPHPTPPSRPLPPKDFF